MPSHEAAPIFLLVFSRPHRRVDGAHHASKFGGTFLDNTRSQRGHCTHVPFDWWVTVRLSTSLPLSYTVAVLPKMMEKNHGHIVTISSAAGVVGVPGLADYSASKHAAKVCGMCQKSNQLIFSVSICRFAHSILFISVLYFFQKLFLGGRGLMRVFGLRCGF